jgi:hypothetical protein
MNATSPHISALRSVFEHSRDGVVGMVDDLLNACQEHGLQLEWTPEHCRVRSNGGDWEELAEVPLRESVFRAILARVAVLCNERKLNSVSPYGGRGELSIGVKPTTIFKVAFANTAEEQKLELVTEAKGAKESRGTEINLRDSRRTQA